MKRRDVLKLGAASILSKPMAAFAGAAQNTMADVVVIGTGGAGYSAAITAHDLGAKVVMLEKMPITGGNTQIASGGMNAAGTRYQAEQGIKDSWQLMFDDTMKGGHMMGDPALVDAARHDVEDRRARCQQQHQRGGDEYNEVGELRHRDHHCLPPLG